MRLSVQVISMIVSFLYGIFLSFLINLNYRFLFMGKKLMRILTNLLFALDTSLFYFLMIKKINEGIIHPYFYLLITIGFLLCFPKTTNVRKLFKNDKQVSRKEKKH